MGEFRERVFQDFRGEEVIELASRLIKIPSVNPPGDTSEIAAFVKNYLEEEGVAVELCEPAEKRVNLIAEIGEGESNRVLVLNGHLDVVPIGDRSRWSFDPFSGEVRDGYLLGRGASDMKGGLAGIIYAFKRLIKFEDRLRGRLKLVCVADEETGGAYGASYLVEKGKALGSSVLIAEPTGMNLINVGEKGAVWAKVTVKGVPGHGSLSPFIGDNAIVKSTDLIRELMRLTEMRAELPRDLLDVADYSRNLLERFVSREASKAIDHPTINFGIIRGGTKVNIIPDRCELEIDVRIPIGLPAAEVTSRIRRIVEKYGEVEFVNVGEPNYTPPNSEIVRIVEKNVREIVGIEPRPFLEWASSDARHFRRANIPTIHYGPAEMEGIHGYNERVKVEDLINAAKVYLGVAIDYLT
ncbi:MAG: succinyl-diaminopimelate desuccinylase [Candidatus Wolframiiraptor sp. EX4484-121]|nr:MAG: succinyl-diaminopimelate desuccinylase [Candidatus Wolframiiraptor sp. EX4484-121]